nr:Possible Na+/H+ antiporter, CPA1 family [Moritella viscosa]SHO10653.1 Possible Na+/H+ antiporter, CPA1 family [Moritella viscosa]SHO17576.1 Possible Na+/H+ antiporter, CPA1 family [Moritella viscosa]
MDEHVVILIIALIVLFYGFISKKFAQFDISGPMVFTVLGLICSPFGLGITAVEVDAEFVTVLVEITLVLVLFSDAALLDLKLLRRSWHIPARLLFIALPLTIFAGTAAAVWLFPDQAIIYMILLALLLTPTDAALGKAVVSDPKVPNMIRSSINVESGLNDGIVFPVVLTVVALITSGLSKADDYNWIWYVAEQIVFGMLVGGMVGYLGAKLLNKAIAHNWIEESYQNLIPIALAILGFYLAEALLGNGFIAAFLRGYILAIPVNKRERILQSLQKAKGSYLFLLASFCLV